MNFSTWNSAIETVYAAAAAPYLWPDVLQTIADTMDAEGATLLYRHEDGRIGSIVSPGLAALAVEYGERWQHLDVRAERAFHALACGHHDVLADHLFFTEQEAAELPIFRDFLYPHGLGWSMGVPVSPLPAVQVLLTLLLAKDRPGYDAAARDRFQMLSRHVERALGLSIRLMDAEAERDGLAVALDRIDCGVFILGSDRHLLHANRTAHALMGSGLILTAGRLRATDPEAQKALQIRCDAAGGEGATARAAADAALLVPNGERGLMLQVLPLISSLGVPDLQTARVIVLASDPSGNHAYDPSVVRDAFRLTLGEARLAALIGAGTSPNAAAAALGIAEATARTVLKRVFAKMGVSRQSEMATLMGRLFMLRQH